MNAKASAAVLLKHLRRIVRKIRDKKPERRPDDNYEMPIWKRAGQTFYRRWW
jgi:hypothetical protein